MILIYYREISNTTLAYFFESLCSIVSSSAHVICLQGKNAEFHNVSAIQTSTRTLLVRILLITHLLSCLIISVVYIWTWTVTEQTVAESSSRCVDFNKHLHQRKLPLLCIFTTFKPRDEKIPVSTKYLPWFLMLLIVAENVLSVFGYPKYSSVTNMLLELGLPSFNTLIHNCKVSFANRVAVCDNAVVKCVLPFM